LGCAYAVSGYVGLSVRAMKERIADDGTVKIKGVF
jgi:hypothetical protein